MIYQFNGLFTKQWLTIHIIIIIIIIIIVIIIVVIIVKIIIQIFSWSNGLLFHQAVVDLARSAILIPMGKLMMIVLVFFNLKFKWHELYWPNGVSAKKELK